VWAPPNAHGVPVMAHIHGGGFFKAPCSRTCLPARAREAPSPD
jgi:carboxylesterase type B